VIDARLSLALDGDGLLLPSDGRLLAVRPGAEAQLAGFTPDRTDIVQDFKPTHAAWAARGNEVLTAPKGPYAAGLVCLPRSKNEARALIAQAVSCTDGTMIVDGQKTDGIDGVLRAVREEVPLLGQITKAHGKLFWFDAAKANFAAWADGPALTSGGFWTAPGVFSADGIDPASNLLAAFLPETLGQNVADLGAGWGFLAAHVLTRPCVVRVDLVEAAHLALECARHNVTDARARFHWVDATAWAPETPLDAVVMNPPFHQGRGADPALGQAFIETAARALKPSGALWMVANRHLPYEATLARLFGEVEELGADPRFKLFRATRPKRKRH
jgi:16S rRNA (guanine1207-N2)-methyltransferase